MESSDMQDCSVQKAFTWEITEFSKKKVLNSGVFSAIGYKWCILAYPGFIEAGYLAAYLLVTDLASLPCGWNRSAEIRLSLINQVDSNLTHTKEAYHEFNGVDTQCSFTDFVPLSKLNDSREGYIVNGTLLFEAVVDLPRFNHKRKRVTQISKDMENHDTAGFLIKSWSVLKKRSIIACAVIKGFLLEFVDDFPTYKKFEQVIEDLKAAMYGGKMGDIFEEWSPRIVEIKVILADIKDMEQQLEALQRDARSKLEESLATVWQAKLDKWKEVESTAVKTAPDKLKALKEIKKLNHQEADVIMTEYEDFVVGEGEREKVIMEKKARIVDWLSNPLPP